MERGKSRVCSGGGVLNRVKCHLIQPPKQPFPLEEIISVAWRSVGILGQPRPHLEVGNPEGVSWSAEPTKRNTAKSTCAWMHTYSATPAMVFFLLPEIPSLNLWSYSSHTIDLLPCLTHCSGRRREAKTTARAKEGSKSVKYFSVERLGALYLSSHFTSSGSTGISPKAFCATRVCSFRPSAKSSNRPAEH